MVEIMMMLVHDALIKLSNRIVDSQGSHMTQPTEWQIVKESHQSIGQHLE